MRTQAQLKQLSIIHKLPRSHLQIEVMNRARELAHKSITGKKRSREVCEKIRLSQLGKKYSEKHKLSVSNAMSGHKNPNWLGGKSYEIYPLGWSRTHKEQIRRRDNYICQGKDCGIHEAECRIRLHVHHIDYNKQNIEHCNLISLCNSCHSKTNHNREYWKVYFVEKNIRHI